MALLSNIFCTEYMYTNKTNNNLSSLCQQLVPPNWSNNVLLHISRLTITMFQDFTSKHPICLRKKKKLFGALHFLKNMIQRWERAVIITKLSKITSTYYCNRKLGKLQGSFKVMLKRYFSSKWIDLQRVKKGKVVDLYRPLIQSPKPAVGHSQHNYRRCISHIIF